MKNTFLTLAAGAVFSAAMPQLASAQNSDVTNANLNQRYAQAFNDGVNSYNAKDFDKAIANFNLASQIRPQDTTAVVFTAYAMEFKQDYAGARAKYNQLLGMNYTSVILYTRLLQMAKQENNTVMAAKILQQALVAYPNNKAFMLEDFNVSLAGGKGRDTLEKINCAITADPLNSNLYAVRGSVYDQQKQSDLALADYRKAVELDPNNFDAQFNLGVYNYNRAAEAYTNASKMDPKAYQVHGRKMESEGKRHFESALAYFEKAIVLQPIDQNALLSLQKVYFRLGRIADSKRVADKLTTLQPKSHVYPSGTVGENIYSLKGDGEAANSSVSDTIVLPLTKEGGVYVAPVKINGIGAINFIFDTGASETTVTADVVSTLIRMKLISEGDFLSGASYQLADGSVVKSPRFMVRTLEIGGTIFRNIEVAISGAKGEPLLGQNVLSKFSSVTQDTKSGKLLLKK